MSSITRWFDGRFQHGRAGRGEGGPAGEQLLLEEITRALGTKATPPPPVPTPLLPDPDPYLVRARAEIERQGARAAAIREIESGIAGVRKILDGIEQVLAKRAEHRRSP